MLPPKSSIGNCCNPVGSLTTWLPPEYITRTYYQELSPFQTARDKFFVTGLLFFDLNNGSFSGRQNEA